MMTQVINFPCVFQKTPRGNHPLWTLIELEATTCLGNVSLRIFQNYQGKIFYQNTNLFQKTLFLYYSLLSELKLHVYHIFHLFACNNTTKLWPEMVCRKNSEN